MRKIVLRTLLGGKLLSMETVRHGGWRGAMER